MLESSTEDTLTQLQPGAEIGVSPWITVTQSMITEFGSVTLDPDPMHVDPEWAQRNGLFGGTIAFGFLTISLLTNMLHAALGTNSGRDPKESGYYLNYGFDRLRLVSPVRTGKRIRGRFVLLDRKRDERNRVISTFECTIEIEGEERPALYAQWLTVWVPPEH